MRATKRGVCLMQMCNQQYHVLVVSMADTFRAALEPLLTSSRFASVQFLDSIQTAKRVVLERTYDFIIINVPLSGDFGIDFAIDMSNNQQTIVLLFVQHSLYEEIYDKVLPYGVFTLSKPATKQTVQHALDWMISVRERLRKLEKKSVSIQDKMEEIRLVNRAKWILITALSMTEPEAHRYIEKQSMNQCVSRRIIAEDIIQTYGNINQ